MESVKGPTDRERELASGYHGVGSVSEVGTACLLASYRTELVDEWCRKLPDLVTWMNRHSNERDAGVTAPPPPGCPPYVILSSEIVVR
jgi:hypothetical protein